MARQKGTGSQYKNGLGKGGKARSVGKSTSGEMGSPQKSWHSAYNNRRRKANDEGGKTWKSNIKKGR